MTTSLMERQVNFLRKFGILIIFAETQKIPFIITAYARTQSEQFVLFKQGKANCDGYTKRSKHQDRLAIDILILDAEWKPINGYSDAPEYHVLGAEWERMGGIWGGGAGFLAVGLNDVFHFQAGPSD